MPGQVPGKRGVSDFPARQDPTLAYASPSLFATASLLENWIDEAEQCTWFLFEAARAAE